MTAQDQPPPVSRIAAGAGVLAVALPALLDRVDDLIRDGGSKQACLVVASTRDQPVEPVRLLDRAARVAWELKSSFPDAEPPVELGRGRVAAIVPVDDGTPAHLIRARLAMGRIDGVSAAEVVAVPLPALLEELPGWAAALG